MYHLFIYSCRLHSCFFLSFFMFLHFLPMTTFFFFPRKPEPLGTDRTIRRIIIDDSTGDTNRTFGGPSIRDPSGVIRWMIGGLDDVENVWKWCFSFWFGNTCGLLDWWIVGGGMFFYFRSPPEIERKMLDGLGVGLGWVFGREDQSKVQIHWSIS